MEAYYLQFHKIKMIKRFYQEKLLFLHLFWFVIKNADPFPLLFWILEGLDPKDKNI